MKIIKKVLDVTTTKDEQMIDITEMVRETLIGTSIKNGTLYLFVPHTTSAVTINENTDPNVKKDMLYSLKQSFPIEKEFLHFEGNSHAHIKSSVIGNDQTVFIEDNDLLLGRWQALYFCEFDGPRQRKLNLQFVGE
ncbi:MAG: secondary thiamine-phosphate synthase enzyme YjbQ [Tenericutes bacterium]|jgi:secondary thiamine-phosphate synthase enzyme|nr:secondary thiamine-phosphate synthase enzyme YjbQ [Mycoplasmatota bacterium]